MPVKDSIENSNIIAIAKMPILILLMIMILSSQAAQAATWPDCGFHCTAGDVTLQKLYLGDASGNPLPPCSSGIPTTGYLWMTIYNNANSQRYAVIFLADIYVNGVLQSTLYPQGACVLDSIPPKTTASYKIYTLNWICGQEVKLSRMVLSWETSSTTCGSARRDCSNRNTKCDGGMSVEVAASIPLSINFATNSPQCCCGNITFTDKTNGGVPPYRYDWNFGDGSAHSSDQNPAHLYGTPGNYTATLTVISAEGSRGTASKQITISPRLKADAGPDKSFIYSDSIIIGGIKAATGGQGPYSYRWSPTSGLSDPLSPNPTASPASTTTYTVNVTDSQGCSGTDSMTLYKSGLQMAVQPSSSIVLVGQRVTYTYLIRNEGETTVSISGLSDNKAGAVSNLNRTTLMPGESATGSATYTVAGSDLPGPDANEAIVSGTDDYGLKLSAHASTTVYLDLGMVHPIIECVREEADGTYTAFFGYRSDGSESLTIPVGEGNGFLPSPSDRGQPTVFLPGRHQLVFSTKFYGSELIWWIGGHTVGASSRSGRCPIPECAIEGPASICEDSFGTYTSPGFEVPPYSYSYSWTLDGRYIGDQRTLNIDGDRYRLGNHILSLAIGKSYNDLVVSDSNCSTTVAIEPHIDASVKIISVE